MTFLNSISTRFFFLLILLVPAVSHGQIIVDSALDDNGGGVTLREAIAAANPGDVVLFESDLNGQTITLTMGELVIDKNLTIEGPGADQLTIDGGGISRIFRIDDGIENSKLTVTISGLTLTNGKVMGQGGGAVINFEKTSISFCRINNNESITSNDFLAYGGAINNVEGDLVIDTCEISENVNAGEGGGGIATTSGNLTVNNSLIKNNTANLIFGPGGFPFLAGGGGLLVENTGSKTSVVNTTFYGNTARVGGAIAVNREIFPLPLTHQRQS